MLLTMGSLGATSTPRSTRVRRRSATSAARSTETMMPCRDSASWSLEPGRGAVRLRDMERAPQTTKTARKPPRLRRLRGPPLSRSGRVSYSRGHPAWRYGAYSQYVAASGRDVKFTPDHSQIARATLRARAVSLWTADCTCVRSAIGLRKTSAYCLSWRTIVARA